MNDKKDFFISYTKEDEQWALWIAGTLEQNGYKTIIQAWDFEAGGNFIEDMDNALKDSKQLIAVWSEAYSKSVYCKAEWTSAFTNYAINNKRAIIPILISNVKPTGLLASITYIDLYNVEKEKRADVLLKKLQPSKGRGENSVNPSNSGNFGGIFHNLPHAKNLYFTGRTDTLNLIHSNFKSGDAASLVLSISGLGGVGKSSIALEYAYKHLEEYDTIWWVNSSGFDTTLSDIKKFALKKQIISEDATTDDVIEEMKYWFSNNKKWLFIYDNADSDDFNKWLEPFLPQSRNGHVLITTRSRFFPKAKSVDITVFNETEAVSFLNKRTDKNGDGYSDDLAKNLSKLLQYLPLALEQAAAYIVETPGVSYQDYIDLLEKYGIDIFQKKTSDGKDFYLVDYSLIINTTWKISMDKITNIGAVQMFNMCAYLAPDKIPVNMFVRGKDVLPPDFKKDIESDLERNEIIRDLTRYSLLSCEKEELLSKEKRVLYMHRLLQEVVQKSFGTDYRWLSHCLSLTNNITDWKDNNKESIDSFKHEAPHVTAVAKKSAVIFNEDDEKIENAAITFYLTGIFYGKLSYLDLSISCVNSHIDITERLCAEKRPALNIKCLTNNLFMAYMNRGYAHNLNASYIKAIEDLNKSIDIGERLSAKGELHFKSELATAYMNRGITYENLKKHDEALSDKNRAIEILELLYNRKSLDNENDLALAYMNRGVTFGSKAKHNESLTDYNKSIEIWERMKSEGKIISENNLALAYGNKSVISVKMMSKENSNRLSKDGGKIYTKAATNAMLNYRKKQLNGG